MESPASAHPHEGFDFGVIEPLAPGIWRWPYTKMEVGDSFLVHQEQKPIGAVRAYTAGEVARLGRKFSVTTEGDYAKVTRVDPGETMSERQAARAQLAGGDGEKYLGVLDPTDQRWAWPFAQMEPGQYFHVPHEARHPEKVRAFAYLRGKYLGIPISVNVNDPEMLGHCRVEYLEGGHLGAKTQTDVEYGVFDQILQAHYGIAEGDIGFIGSPAQHKTYEIEQISPPRNDRLVVSSFDGAAGVEFFPDRIELTKLPPGTLCANWAQGIVRGSFAAQEPRQIREPHSSDSWYAMVQGAEIEHMTPEKWEAEKAANDAKAAQIDLLGD